MGNKVYLFISHVWMSMVYVFKMFFHGLQNYMVLYLSMQYHTRKGETLDFMSLLLYSDNYGIFPLGMMGGIIGCSIDISIV